MDAAAPDEILEALLDGRTPSTAQEHALAATLGDVRRALTPPVPADVEAAHLAAMFAVAPAPRATVARRGRSRRALVAAACASVTMMYGGFAAAGAIPSPNAIRHHVQDFFSGTGTPTSVPAPSAVAPGHTGASSVEPPAVVTPRREHGTTATTGTPGDGAADRAPTPPDSAPGASGATPGHGATPPGHGGESPGQVVTPGKDDTGNGNAKGNPPADPPGQSITTPGNDGATSPGQGGTAPGQAVAPGRQDPANGNADPDANANAGNDSAGTPNANAGAHPNGKAASDAA